MTARAVAGHIAVIERGRQPAIGGVAVIAVVVTGDVVDRLARGRAAVVAAEAGPEHISMVDPDYRDPARVAVAVLALTGGLDVGAVLAGRGTAVVTARAVAGHIGVIEGRR